MTTNPKKECHDFTCGQVATCRKCWGAAYIPALAASLGRKVVEGPPVALADASPCGCDGKCDDCGKSMPPVFEPKPDDPAVGVAVGVYRWPSLVELQIRTIRHTCGPVPILISNDDPSIAARVAEICGRFPDVFHWPNHERIGHTGGDISAFFKAALWGKARGLRTVAKLSQRFLVTRPRWLQDGARDLIESGLSIATQRCTGTQRFDLRTEAVLLDVATWSQSEVLSRIMPRRYWTDSPLGLSAETVIHRVLKDLAGEFFHPWNLFDEERAAARDGVLWHNANSVADYRQLAANHGVELDAELHMDGWQRDRDRGTYLYG